MKKKPGTSAPDEPPNHPTAQLPNQRPEGRAAALRPWAVPRLRAWFARHRRDLPWRRDRDPYRVWVSEVMLQQTTVAAVVPYFERFLAAFPTLAALAAADEQDVLRLWEGLGYYRRARDLLASARRLVAERAGAVPDDSEALAGLPGFGRYTVNAVLSQAFDRRLPVLEANTQRVLSRLFGRADDPRGAAARAWLWAAAGGLLPRAGSGEVNQALMELGALVCTPAAPRCDACPLAARCEARRQGRQEEWPARPPRPAPTEVQEAAVAVRRGGGVLLCRRPGHGRWANLWELPHGPRADGEESAAAAARLARELAGLDVRVGPELLTLRHGITRYRITLVSHEAEHVAGEPKLDFYTAAEWPTPERLADYPVSAPQRRLMRALAEGGRQRRLF